MLSQISSLSTFEVQIKHFASLTSLKNINKSFCGYGKKCLLYSLHMFLSIHNWMKKPYAACIHPLSVVSQIIPIREAWYAYIPIKKHQIFLFWMYNGRVPKQAFHSTPFQPQHDIFPMQSRIFRIWRRSVSILRSDKANLYYLKHRRVNPQRCTDTCAICVWIKVRSSLFEACNYMLRNMKDKPVSRIKLDYEAS